MTSFMILTSVLLGLLLAGGSTATDTHVQLVTLNYTQQLIHDAGTGGCGFFTNVCKMEAQSLCKNSCAKTKEYTFAKCEKVNDSDNTCSSIIANQSFTTDASTCANSTGHPSKDYCADFNDCCTTITTAACNKDCNSLLVQGCYQNILTRQFLHGTKCLITIYDFNNGSTSTPTPSTTPTPRATTKTTTSPKITTPVKPSTKPTNPVKPSTKPTNPVKPSTKSSHDPTATESSHSGISSTHMSGGTSGNVSSMPTSTSSTRAPTTTGGGSRTVMLSNFGTILFIAFQTVQIGVFR